MSLPAAPSSTLPRDLSLGAVLGSLTRVFCAASKPPLWDRCRALGFDCFGEGLEARQPIDSAALMGARLRAKRLASDLDLNSSSGSLPVQPGISGPGHQATFVPRWESCHPRRTRDPQRPNGNRYDDGTADACVLDRRSWSGCDGWERDSWVSARRQGMRSPPLRWWLFHSFDPGSGARSSRCSTRR